MRSERNEFDFFFSSTKTWKSFNFQSLNLIFEKKTSIARVKAFREIGENQTENKHRILLNSKTYCQCRLDQQVMVHWQRIDDHSEDYFR